MAALLTLFRHATRAELPVPDPALLDRFAVGRDETAFAELVRRHGPVVYRICRRLVGTSAADDAFQATFLVLATRLDAARAAGSVGGWLVGVAGRVARQMRRSAARRTHHETTAAGACSPDGADHRIDLADQFRVLDEELARLPDRLRDPWCSASCRAERRRKPPANSAATPAPFAAAWSAPSASCAPASNAAA